jgi:hypothetical protein
VCYISKAIHEDMVCERHPDGCGRFLNPGDIIFIDASQCRFYRCTWYVSCRKLNSDGCRTCKVGYVKVLADMMHLVGNRIGVITSIHVHDIDHTEIRSKTKVITKYDKKKPVTQQPETKKSARAAMLSPRVLLLRRNTRLERRWTCAVVFMTMP